MYWNYLSTMTMLGTCYSIHWYCFDRMMSMYYIDRIKIGLMEKQLASLTELVKQLTHVEHQPTKMGQLIDSNTKSLYQQLRDLKIKTFHLRDDLSSIRRMQLSLQENFQQELEDANRKIEVTIEILHC